MMNFGKKDLQKKKNIYSPEQKPFRNRFSMLVMRILLLLVIALTVIVIWRGGSFVRSLLTELPDIGQIEGPLHCETKILDMNGEETASCVIVQTAEDAISLDAVPDALKWAFVDTFDEKFYTRNNRSSQRFLSVLGHYLTGNSAEAADTLEEQLLHNYMLTDPGEGELLRDVLTREMQEQYLAFHMEDDYGKNWILARYLSSVCLGEGLAGVTDASAFYFGKAPADLTVAECAALAAAAENPLSASPSDNPQGNRENRQKVLKGMYENGHLNRQEYISALGETISARPVTVQKTAFSKELFDAFVRNMESDPGMTEADAVRLFYYGGLTIYSTQDTKMQGICEQLLSGPEQETGQQIRTVLLDSHFGEVRAIAGAQESMEGESGVQKSVEENADAPSVMDLFSIYAPVLDLGEYTLSSKPLEAYGGADADVTIAEAIRTQNVPVKAFLTERYPGVTGTDALAAYRRSNKAAQEENTALSGEDVAVAFSALASGGVGTEPVYYQKIIDGTGRVLSDRTAQAFSVMKDTTACLLTETIREKTGAVAYCSSADGADAWAAGYSPSCSCVVHIQADDTGEQAEEICRMVMRNAESETDETNYNVPEGIVTEKICPLSGKRVIEGVCPESETYTYVSGTQPGDMCDRHLAAYICRESGALVTEDCPPADWQKQIYDTAADGADAMPDHVCGIHGK